MMQNVAEWRHSYPVVQTIIIIIIIVVVVVVVIFTRLRHPRK